MSKPLIYFLILGLIAVMTSHAKASTQVITASKGKEGEVVRHSGDFVVGGRKTRIIEDVTFMVDGNIIVKDRGKLVVRNAELILTILIKVSIGLTSQIVERLS